MQLSEFQKLVERYIADDCSPQEVEVLRSLLKQPEYVRELDSIMDRQLASNDATPADYQQTVNRLKEEIARRIMQGRQAPARANIFSLSRRWVAAASIILLMGLTAILWINLSSPKKPEQSIAGTPQTLNLAPGKEGAILVLDNGDKMVLDSLGNGFLIDQKGTKISLVNGQLQYKAATPEAELSYNTLSTPRGRQFQLLLPDGSKVWLNAASSIRYPTVFKGKERKVEITGEAYFEVAKNPKMPFHVKINGQTEVEVLGTHFNINSYTDEESINTTLLEGSVKVRNRDQSVIIKPGRQAQVSTASSIQVINDVDLDKVMAWKNGVFNFDDASLQEVMRQLARWYNIEVAYEKGIPPMQFMGKMGRDLSLSEVLRGLEVSKVHFRMEAGRKLVVLP